MSDEAAESPRQVRFLESTEYGTPLSNFQRRLDATIDPSGTNAAEATFAGISDVFANAMTDLDAPAVAAMTLALKQLRTLVTTNKQTIATRPSQSKISYKDVLAITKHDTAGLTTKISNNPESFLKGLFAIRRRRMDYPAWNDASFLKLQEGDDASTITTIDLLCDFHKVTLPQVTALAVQAWNVSNASTLAMDGESNLYICKSFANFLFASLDESFTRTLQNSVADTLWNDGPVIWMHLVFHVFPSAAVFNSSLKASLGSLKVVGTDYPSYITRLREGLILVQESPSEEIIYNCLFQMSLHPSSIVRSHFEQLGVAYILQRPERKTLHEMMTEADSFHTIAFDKSLPFSKSKEASKGSQAPDSIA